MPRLLQGENAHIDNINKLVYNVKHHGDQDAMGELLIIFNPLILSLCKKWGTYFRDTRHQIKPLDDLIADAQEWFIHYIDKYTIDGDATFNTFIASHLSQRIRYIYETELKYYKRHIFPDPDKHNEDSNDQLEDVIYNYASNIHDTEEIDTPLLQVERQGKCVELLDMILNILTDRTTFNEREEYIYKQIILQGRTHDSLCQEYGISRTRVTQILRKTKIKLYNKMNNDATMWELISDLDIEFREM